MGFLEAALPFLKVFGAFGLMLICIRCRFGLGPAILTGGFAMAVLFGLPLLEWLQVGALALTKEKFLFLAAIVGSILMLSDGLERSGQSGRLMDALAGYLTRPLLRLIFFPALIGLLPMPGGAVFSAPMIKAVSEGMDVGNEDRALINYWFRHVWEMAWPLYPGIILTVALADIPISSFISKSWPGIVAMFFFGWYFLLRPTPFQEEVNGNDSPRSLVRAAWQGLPLMVAIAGAVGLETLISILYPAIPFELGVLVALWAAIACIMMQNRLKAGFFITVLTNKNHWSMLFVIAAIFIFKDIMQAAGVVDEMAAVSGGGLALFGATVLLPFLVGMVAGINVAFVGATFPLLLGLLETLGMSDQVIPYLVLATFSGFTGVMVSPLHICFLLTCEYFAADLGRTWRRLIAPCFGLGLTGFVVFWILV